MKSMLITGSNRGLGLACVEEFKKDYEIISVSRHEGSTETGDLQDRKFLAYLVSNHNPDVLINNAGIALDDFSAQFDTNLFQAGFLATKFYAKMKPGSIIINICSDASNLRGWKNMQDAQMYYIATKASLKNISNMLSRSKRRPVRVTSLEPAYFVTDFANIKNRWNVMKDNIPSNHMWYGQRLMTPDYIAKTIRWITEQPENVEIASLEILNSIVP